MRSPITEGAESAPFQREVVALKRPVQGGRRTGRGWRCRPMKRTLRPDFPGAQTRRPCDQVFV